MIGRRMSGLVGGILFVHPDRKTQRQVGRVLATSLRPVHAVDSLGDGLARLDGRMALAIVSSRLADGGFAGFRREAELAGTVTILLGEGAPADILPLVVEHDLSHVAGADPMALADELPTTVQKLLRGDTFGLDKYLTWSAELQSTEIVATSDRRRALLELREALVPLGLSPRHERQATLIADELLSNAIHNAPVDAAGVHYLRDEPRDTHRPLSGPERPRLRWACDGRYLAVEVTDRWGTLDPATVRQHVGKLTDRDGGPRTGGGGAGLGLAMAFQAASALVFNLARGRSTQALALIDLRVRPDGPRALTPSFHLFYQGSHAG